MNREIVGQIQEMLAENGHTLESLWDYCGKRNVVVPLNVPGRERVRVYVEKFGRDAALVTEDGKIIGNPVAFSSHHFYVGNAGPERVATFRTTIIPDGYRG